MRIRDIGSVELEAGDAISEKGELSWPNLEKKGYWMDRAEVLALASDLSTSLIHLHDNQISGTQQSPISILGSEGPESYSPI
jgi:hypothetical protein